MMYLMADQHMFIKDMNVIIDSEFWPGATTFESTYHSFKILMLAAQDRSKYRLLH